MEGVHVRFKSAEGVNVRTWFSSLSSVVCVCEAFMYNHDMVRLGMTDKQAAEYNKEQFEMLWRETDKIDLSECDLNDRVDRVQSRFKDLGYTIISRT